MPNPSFAETRWHVAVQRRLPTGAPDTILLHQTEGIDETVD